MDFGASSEYVEYLEYLKRKNSQKKDNSESESKSEPKPESCPMITVITNSGATIQIPLPVSGSKFTKSKTCYLTCYLENGT